MTQLSFNLTEEKLKLWSEMTDKNDHTGVMLEIISHFSSFPQCRALRGHRVIMEGVQRLHNELGHLPRWLKNVRAETFNAFLEDLKIILGPDDAKTFQAVWETL
jgi:hypothetical protein